MSDLEHSHSQEHTHDDGTVHTHEQSHTHSHGPGAHSHTHSPDEVKAVINRLSRAIGHLESVKNMVADGRDCSEVLVQLSAVRSALNSTGILILQNHIDHCIVDAVQCGDMDAVADLNKAIKNYLK